MADRTRGNERFGWGPSDLASAEERERYRAAQISREIEAGRATVADLPEAYGGRPLGNTRRSLRMQQAWDAEQAARIKQEEAMRQMENEMFDRREKLRESARADASLELRKAEYEDRSDREDAIKREAMNLVVSLRGSTLPDGTVLRPINPMDDDAISRLEGAAVLNRYGLEDPAARAMWERKYTDAQKFAEQRFSTTQKRAEQEKTWLVGQQEEAASLGVDTSKFFTTKIDPETQEMVVAGVDQLGLTKALGESKRKDIENKKKEIKESQVSEEIRGEAKDVLKGIEEVDKQIREANFMASREESEKNRDEYLARAEYLRGERDVLANRFKNLIPRKEEAQQAEAPEAPRQTGIIRITSKQEFDNLPSGTEFIAPDGTRRRKQ
jgi:hypothetical protein